MAKCPPWIGDHLGSLHCVCTVNRPTSAVSSMKSHTNRQQQRSHVLCSSCCTRRSMGHIWTHSRNRDTHHNVAGNDSPVNTFLGSHPKLAVHVGVNLPNSWYSFLITSNCRHNNYTRTAEGFLTKRSGINYHLLLMTAGSKSMLVQVLHQTSWLDWTLENMWCDSLWPMLGDSPHIRRHLWMLN